MNVTAFVNGVILLKCTDIKRKHQEAWTWSMMLVEKIKHMQCVLRQLALHNYSRKLISLNGFSWLHDLSYLVQLMLLDFNDIQQKTRLALWTLNPVIWVQISVEPFSRSRYVVLSCTFLSVSSCENVQQTFSQELTANLLQMCHKSEL